MSVTTVGPKLFVWVHPEYRSSTHADGQVRFNALLACGAVLLNNGELAATLPQPGDHLMVWGVMPDFLHAAKDRFLPEHRWLFNMDEGCDNAGNGSYDKSLRYMRKIDLRNLVLTYPNVERVARIRLTGARVVAMPQCVPSIRPRVPKARNVIVTGQLSDGVYPTRTRLSRLLARHAQQFASHSAGAPDGEAYFKRLDETLLGVVCRAGLRDRFVSKYVEFGASHVLPVGDCPTYMPPQLKVLMVNVEGMDDRATVAEVDRLLMTPDELRLRADAYADAVGELYLARPNVDRVIKEVLSQ